MTSADLLSREKTATSSADRAQDGGDAPDAQGLYSTKLTIRSVQVPLARSLNLSHSSRLAASTSRPSSAPLSSFLPCCPCICMASHVSTEMILCTHAYTHGCAQVEESNVPVLRSALDTWLQLPIQPLTNLLKNTPVQYMH